MAIPMLCVILSVYLGGVSVLPVAAKYEKPLGVRGIRETLNRTQSNMDE
jgi:hypothetical protein